MKKRIYSFLTLTALCTVFITSAVIIFTYFTIYSNQAKVNLQTQSDILASALEHCGDDIDYLNTLYLSEGGTQITLIDESGEVLYDTYNNSADNDYLSLPEFIQAEQSGTGFDYRYTRSSEEVKYYHVTKLEDGNFLRVATVTQSIYSIFLQTLPLLMIIAIIGILVCIFLAERLTSNIMRPIENISKNTVNTNEYYDELSPFIDKIGNQNAEIEEQKSNLEQQKNTLNIITDNMNEGLILVDNTFMILSNNRSAAQLLGSVQDFLEGQSLLDMCRDLEFIEAVRLASQGKTQNYIMHHNAKYIEVFINPIYYNAKISGIAILLLDITDKHSAEVMRREFSANVSHELKTPLTSISGYAEMLATDMASKADIKIFAQKIHSESLRLINLIQDIISISQLDEKLTDTDFTAVSLQSAIKFVFETLENKAADKEIVLSLTGDDRNVVVNPSMFHQLVHNLVDNAIKYNNQGGKVEVQINAKSFTVSDTGIGIPEEHLERIFERFYRVDKSRSKKTGGTGLGLAIVKHIAGYHNSTVSVESEENIGTKITVHM